VTLAVAPKKQGESEFAFYDSSARPEYNQYRELVNGWIEELPEADRAEIISRMQKGDSLQYQAALAELTTHAALRRKGYIARRIRLAAIQRGSPISRCRTPKPNLLPSWR
jgi:hypothetical protein